jgi:hypothetical protein
MDLAELDRSISRAGQHKRNKPNTSGEGMISPEMTLYTLQSEWTCTHIVFVHESWNSEERALIF